MYRIGLGYDIHKLTKGRDLIIGGVKITHEKGLLGHSDADVLIHAIIDGMLGALSLSDIGTLFPDNDIEYKNKFYDCWICIEDDHRDVELVNATITKLSNLELKKNDTMIMSYDTGSTTTFKITFLEERSFERGNGMHYPYIIDGAGYGMIDNITSEELKEVVNDIDKTGNSDYYALCIDGRNSYNYDYRIFDLDKNNLYVRRYFYKIKYSYESGEE